jgi:hypothetical protein
MKKIKFILLLLICLWTVPDLFGQSGRKIVYERDFESVIKRENRYNQVRERVNDYVNTFPDTLLYKKKIYLFRHTPLFLKSRYTDVFSDEVVSIGGTPVLPMKGAKGYTLRWIIRNDSLFIQNIFPRYFGKYVVDDDGSTKIVYDNVMCGDTVKSKIEHFVGNKFKNNLLHVDWVTGDFGIIDSYNPEYSNMEFYIALEETGVHVDGRAKGYIMTFENGILKEMKKDKREIKN